MDIEILNSQTLTQKRGRGRPKIGEIVEPKKYVKKNRPKLTEEEKKERTLEYSRKQRRERAEECRISHRVYYYRQNYRELFTDEELIKYRSIIDKYAGLKIAFLSIKDENPEQLKAIINSLLAVYLKSHQENEATDSLSQSSTNGNNTLRVGWLVQPTLTENENENENEN